MSNEHPEYNVLYANESTDQIDGSSLQGGTDMSVDRSLETLVQQDLQLQKWNQDQYQEHFEDPFSLFYSKLSGEVIQTEF